jgi:putative FmdB family regulatory protein
MPMYEYRCRECGERFEEIRSVSDSDQGVLCPRCAGGAVEKLFSTFATSGPASTSGSGGGSCGPRGFS